MRLLIWGAGTGQPRWLHSLGARQWWFNSWPFFQTVRNRRAYNCNSTTWGIAAMPALHPRTRHCVWLGAFCDLLNAHHLIIVPKALIKFPWTTRFSSPRSLSKRSNNNITWPQRLVNKKGRPRLSCNIASKSATISKFLKGDFATPISSTLAAQCQKNYDAN